MVAERLNSESVDWSHQSRKGWTLLRNTSRQPVNAETMFECGCCGGFRRIPDRHRMPLTCGCDGHLGVRQFLRTAWRDLVIQSLKGVHVEPGWIRKSGDLHPLLTWLQDVGQGRPPMILEDPSKGFVRGNVRLSVLEEFAPSAQCPNPECRSWRTKITETRLWTYERVHRCCTCSEVYRTWMLDRLEEPGRIIRAAMCRKCGHETTNLIGEYPSKGLHRYQCGNPTCKKMFIVNGAA